MDVGLQISVFALRFKPEVFYGHDLNRKPPLLPYSFID